MLDRRPLAPALALLVALAGCSGAPGSTESRASPADTAGLRLEGCTNLGAVFPVPLESARAALPPGFEPVVSAGDPAGGATLYVLGLRCDDALVAGVSQGPAQLAYAELAVVPPAELAIDDIADYTVPLLFTAQPAAVGDVLAAYRLGLAGAGSVSWEDLAPLPETVITATLGDATLTLTAVTATAQPAALGSGAFALFGVQDGEVRSTIRGFSEGGASVPAVVRLQASGGPPLLAEARQAARGFSVSGFSLDFAALR